MIITCMLITGCGGMSRIVKQPDGTFVKEPVMEAWTCLLDLEYETTKTKIAPDGQKIITHEKFSTKGRGTDYVKGLGVIMQGAAGTLF